MDEFREPEELPEREPDHAAWEGLFDVEIEIAEAVFEAESPKIGRIRSRFRSATGGVAVVASIASICVAATGSTYTAPTIGVIVVAALVTLVILQVGHDASSRRANPAKPRGHAGGQEKARTPPRDQ